LLKQQITPYQRQGFKQKPTSPQLNLKIEQKGIEKLLRQVNPNKASGPDTIPNRILKECAEPIAPILQIILQQSLSTGDLPKDWRDANISSIFKKGDKHPPPVFINMSPVKS
jgi:hypothetical protein